ncbi:MAG: hypothetical protein KGO96_13115 [Elusimicrobia bacterium]|nr:hypothetical protein [Elusimicrobiota bacterium]MDE2426834.1 hypothetical protein [Elusimicrobiota bacterium]
MGAAGAFGLGFAVGFLVTLISITLAGIPFAWLLPLFGYAKLALELELAASAVVGVLFGVTALVMWSIWGALDRKQQFGLVALLFIIGVIFLQPEIDAVALIGLALSYGGVQKALPAKKK